MRMLWAPRWRLSIGEAHYYGWRWWINLGPIVFLAGRKALAEESQR